MGFDAVRGPNTYGSGCMPGCTRQFTWWRENYDAGSLGCYNPASMGGMSLHAEGRAMDIALNARDPDECARGDAIFERVMANPIQFGAQEMLWRGYLWSWRNRDQGKRGPGIQQQLHENHLHLGIDVEAATSWTPGWVGDEPAKPEPPKAEQPKRGRRGMIVQIVDGENEFYELVGGETAEPKNWIKLLPGEAVENKAKGVPSANINRAEWWCLLAGTDMKPHGARGLS